jgi:hypothetical protein
MLRAACWALLLACIAWQAPAVAQSATRNLPRPTTPFVPLYSLCRAVPPDDPVAQVLYKSMGVTSTYAIMQRQLDTLLVKPVDGLSANEAEAYFLLLIEVGSTFSFERHDLEARGAALQSARERGRRIGTRFAQDSFVRCAHLASELFFANRASRDEHDADLARARDAYIPFLEAALLGDVPTTAYRDVLHSAVGQQYLNRGFALLPDTERAAVAFEAGARHLLDAASNPTDERYISNWERYAFMLGHLSDTQQLAIAQRLLARLEAHAHLLNVAGQAALGLRQGKDAVAIYNRQLDVALALRVRAPGDPNQQVQEVLVHMLLGDAHLLNGDRSAATRAYLDAQRTYEASNDAAQNMLRYQDFPKDLEGRRAALR